MMRFALMKNKNVCLYLLALAVCFLIGCGAVLALSYMDSHEYAPLEGGKAVEFTDCGFTMSMPEDYRVFDQTQASLDAGNDVLYAGRLGKDDTVLHLYCYENTAGDDLAAHDPQDVVTHYMSAGAAEVRMRDFGGRPFICYRAEVLAEDKGFQIWDAYETWNPRVQIVFETQAAPRDVLPILATIQFD